MTTTEACVTVTIDGDVAILTMDVPGEAVNALSPRLAAELDAALTAVERDPAVRAVVLRSSKPGCFVAGADLKVLDTITTAAEAEQLSRDGQAGLQRLADLDKPVVAAIHGACLGGGLELALACHARIADDDRATKLGLPEVQLGLIPGAGGTQRLPRLVGIAAALDLILTGKQIDGRRAARLGLVDEACPAALLVAVATTRARSLAAARAAAPPSTSARLGAALAQLRATLFDRAELTGLVLEENPLGRKVLFEQARKQLLAKTHGLYPAPERALDAVRIGASDPDAGYAAEARAFGELLVSPVARELMGLFFATTALKKDPGTDDPKVRARPVEQIAMLGAGLMGAGIAYVSANAGLAVRLRDKDDAGLGRGLAYVREIVDGRVRRKRLTARAGDELMARISPTTTAAGLAQAQVVIEAVFEDVALKHQVVREVEAAVGPETIFASNTSTIPITTIARASRRPETVIGMHYFSPVHKMPLLEVIVTERTAPWVTATCVELGKRQGKTVIVVRDGVGFYTSRILGPYVNEAMHVLAEGAPIEAIDAALVAFGFPVGPIKLVDEVGLDVAAKAGAVVQRAFGDRLQAPPGLERLIADGRFGRKASKGFYRYPPAGARRGDRTRGVDPAVYTVLGLTPADAPPAEALARRCWLQMVNEAAHCFGEGVLRSARDGDIGAVFGLGFPPLRGGPFRWADAYGIARLVDDLDEHAARLGGRFAPAPVLRAMAGSGKTFHGADRQRPGEHGTPPCSTDRTYLVAGLAPRARRTSLGACGECWQQAGSWWRAGSRATRARGPRMRVAPS
ncbi:MAG: fatty acid oxidation complex subunit alpha FadJ [Kofleriaceae bacterium]